MEEDRSRPPAQGRDRTSAELRRNLAARRAQVGGSVVGDRRAVLALPPPVRAEHEGDGGPITATQTSTADGGGARFVPDHRDDVRGDEAHGTEQFQRLISCQSRTAPGSVAALRPADSAPENRSIS